MFLIFICLVIAVVIFGILYLLFKWMFKGDYKKFDDNLEIIQEPPQDLNMYKIEEKFDEESVKNAHHKKSMSNSTTHEAAGDFGKTELLIFIDFNSQRRNENMN